MNSWTHSTPRHPNEWVHLLAGCNSHALPTPPSHGENRGSSPLGSANEIKYLVYIIVEPVCISPIFLQIAISCLHAKGLGLRIWGSGVRISSGAPLNQKLSRK